MVSLGVVLVIELGQFGRPETVKSALRELLIEVENLRTEAAFGNYYDHFTRYMNWRVDSIRKLERLVSSGSISHLILDNPLELRVGDAGPGGDIRHLRTMVDFDRSRRTEALQTAIEWLEKVERTWSGDSPLILPDTSFYLTYPEKLEAIDFDDVLGERTPTLRLVVPMVVVDELDNLKRSKESKVRWRAAYTLAVLDHVYTGPNQLSWLSRGPGSRADVVVDIVFDPPGHQRLPINDDEIVDRALSIERLSRRLPTLVTYDTGQALRARGLGVTVVKLRAYAERAPGSPPVAN